MAPAAIQGLLQCKAFVAAGAQLIQLRPKQRGIANRAFGYGRVKVVNLSLDILEFFPERSATRSRAS